MSNTALFVVETKTAKFKRMDGYQCRGKSPASVLVHLQYHFQRKVVDKATGQKRLVPYYNLSELEKGHKDHKIRIVWMGE